MLNVLNLNTVDDCVNKYSFLLLYSENALLQDVLIRIISVWTMQDIDMDRTTFL